MSYKLCENRQQLKGSNLKFFRLIFFIRFFKEKKRKIDYINRYETKS